MFFYRISQTSQRASFTFLSGNNLNYMRTLLFFLATITSATAFSQSRFIIESPFSESRAKEFMMSIEDYIPNTFNRNLSANRIEFSTLQNHRLGYLDSVATLIGMSNRV